MDESWNNNNRKNGITSSIYIYIRGVCIEATSRDEFFETVNFKKWFYILFFMYLWLWGKKYWRYIYRCFVRSFIFLISLTGKSFLTRVNVTWIRLLFLFFLHHLSYRQFLLRIEAEFRYLIITKLTCKTLKTIFLLIPFNLR